MYAKVVVLIISVSLSRVSDEVQQNLSKAALCPCVCKRGNYVIFENSENHFCKILPIKIKDAFWKLFSSTAFRTLMSLSIGTPKNNKFPFVPNGKFIIF